jgi:hypothetical protein
MHSARMQPPAAKSRQHWCMRIAYGRKSFGFRNVANQLWGSIRFSSSANFVIDRYAHVF